MKAKESNLSFEKIQEHDLSELTAVMTRAFDDDAQKHLGQERGGPPGYDDGEFFRKWLFGFEESIGYKLLWENRIIGAIIVWVFEHANNQVGTIFVDPAYQDRGVGSQTWQFIQQTYPDTKSWKLETPTWATKNHYFYEQKCGFERIGVKHDSVVYQFAGKAANLS